MQGDKRGLGDSQSQRRQRAREHFSEVLKRSTLWRFQDLPASKACHLEFLSHWWQVFPARGGLELQASTFYWRGAEKGIYRFSL
jgi:hypothetical protein